MNPDVTVFHLFNALAGQFPPLDWAVRALVNDYAVPTLLALVLGALWFCGATENERALNQRAVLYTVLGLIITNIVIKGFQQVYFRPRPFATEHVTLLFYRPSVSSMPSEPVATMFCFVTGAWIFNRRVGIALLAVVSAFSVSRLIAGVHYPSDLIVGAALGTFCTWLPVRVGGGIDRAAEQIRRAIRRVNLA